ncbi:uncharacterized protein LOC129311623 isoform X2 [Prosopis cineraria]|uniref:uncharacterized protein LOC129311623 isoform X2 n=1 Tax=Prosopis cineraria TaxID=364024 RepID=UPI00240F0EC2|nr:uncharacterized protein LOC129311623 isoform X2 [Prosopis cineraria]
MDYDDNDFQSQNLHLAGEGSAKFPPVLRPYALPKFDFDESLPGQLRFDNLVETEVFLGIENNEDNQWIDAFPRGSSGIEFSSTAAESCSISRHNNVWSEAASSESVEMLLKSVGQEEFIPRQSVIQESDACNELACLAKQMESNPKADDKNESRGDVASLQPYHNIHEDGSGLKNNETREQPKVGVSQAHENELSFDESSGNMELSDICKNVNLPQSDGIHFTDTKSNNENQQEAGTMGDDSLNDKTLDNSSASGEPQTNITAAPMQNMCATSDSLDIQNVQNQVAGISGEQQGCLTAQTDRQDTESYTFNKDTNVDIQPLDGNAVGTDAHNDNSLCLASKEALSGESMVKGLNPCLTKVDDSLGMVPSNVSDLQKAARCSEDILYGNPCVDGAGGNAVKDAVKDDQFALAAHSSPKVEVKGNTGFVGINNSDRGISSNLQQAVDSAVKKARGESTFAKEKESLSTGHELDMEVSVSKVETPILTVEGSNISEINEHDDSKVEDISRFSMAFSTKSSILGESTQVCEHSEVDKLDEKKNHQDMSVAGQDFTRAPSDSSQMNCDADNVHLVDKGVGSSTISSGSMEGGLSTSFVSADVTALDNSASKDLLDVSLASCGTVDVQPASCNVSSQKVSDQNDVQRKTSPVGSNSVDEKEDSASRIAEETRIYTSILSSQQGTIPCPVTGTEQQSCDISRQLSCETVDNGTKIVETCCTGNISEPQKTINHSKERAKEMDASPFLNEPTTKQEVNPSSKISGDLLLSNQDSVSSAPLSDSHVELHETVGCPANNTCSPSITVERSSQTEKDGNQDPPVSELINKDATNMLLIDDKKGNNASKDKGSLTSELNTEANLSKSDAADSSTIGVGNSQPVPTSTASKASKFLEVSPSSGLDPSKTKTAGDNSHGSAQISDGERARSVSKSTPQRKTRRAPNKTAGKAPSRKTSHVKETPPSRQPERTDKSNNVKLSSPPGFQLMQSNEMLQYGHVDSGSAKPFALLNASTSSLPDLNTSASASVLFQQPFTDLQQIQLRAQIFVYGALIQGTAPDEAYMISAFGGPDGGRGLWENAWRVCAERQHGQKSLLMNPETPVQSRSESAGPRASELAKQGSHQSKGISSPLGRSSSKATPTVVNPLIPLSSPLWNLPTPSDSLQPGALVRGSVLDYPRVPSSLHPYQTPPLRNILGHNTSWISQAPVRGPWIASPAPATDTSSLFSALPISDSVKLNSVKGSTLPPSSCIKSVPPGLPSSNAAPQSIFVGTAPLHDTSNVTVSPAQHSSDPKPKKRKKVMVSEDLGQKALQTQSQLELNPVVSSHVSTVVLATIAGSAPKTTFEKSTVSMSSLSHADHLKSDRSIEKRFLSDESLVKVKEAGVHAEEAAALSAAAVNHSLEIWTQLDKQKNSGLVSVIEAELASAAVTVAAAAAVAKAAAAAAKVASNAALQAKLMAEEALASSGHEGTYQSSEISHSEGIKNLGKATPASILKGPNGTSSSSSIIIAAKEAARRRVEAASAAAKQAENMDAIVKAAELAAEAVSQAGKIVTMGDPLHISDLVEAGPQGCREAPHDSCQQVGSSKGKIRVPVNIDNVGDSATISHTLNRNISSDGMGMNIAASEKSPLHKVYNERSEDQTRPMDGSQIEMHDTSFPVANGSEKLENNIKEGSLVEVFKDGREGCQAAWFTANVLSLKDGKAYVCYSVLVADGGPLKEWIPLESEGDKPPRIRIARPVAGLVHEGMRKRRRSATRDYDWSVGDRVDVWIQESWQEGIVKEKNKKDEITVNFPARGETAVRAWQVRSSLFWKDGKWIEYSSSGANVKSTHEGDTPREKRPKLGSPTKEVKGKDKMLKSIEGGEPVNPNELRLLDLAEKERVFNIGKNSRNETKTDTQRIARTGLQKEGSRVIFGVPKPGKKRKFMEVSKHYVADRSDKVNDGNDSVKLANFLMPQGPAFRGWKNSTKNDTKEKRGANSKSKIVKSGKPSVQVKPNLPKDSPAANAFSPSNDLTDHAEKIKDSASHDNDASERGNRVEMASYSATDGTAEGQGPILYPPLATSSDPPSSHRTTASRASKGKLAPAGGKLGKIEEEKPTTEISEIRRSNRRIQPTSRLLEGLQSSLIISKIPSVSHDKGHKSQNRNASRGNNQG